jgi:hypothetical protein
MFWPTILSWYTVGSVVAVLGAGAVARAEAAMLAARAGAAILVARPAAVAAAAEAIRVLVRLSMVVSSNRVRRCSEDGSCRCTAAVQALSGYCYRSSSP